MVGSSDAGRRQRRQARGRSRGEAAGDEARVPSLYACAGGRSGAIGRRKMEIEKESGVERDTGGEEMGSWEEDGIGQRFLAAQGKQGVGSGEGSEWGSTRVNWHRRWALASVQLGCRLRGWLCCRLSLPPSLLKPRKKTAKERKKEKKGKEGWRKD